jgi:hypothetical protein
MSICARSELVLLLVLRDTSETRAERDEKVLELQELRSKLLELASQVGESDCRLGVSARGFQIALMEILDAEGEEEEMMRDKTACNSTASNETACDETTCVETARDETACDELIQLVRLTIAARAVATGAPVGELSIDNGTLVHVVDGSVLSRRAFTSISSASCDIKQANPFTRVAHLRVNLRAGNFESYEITEVMKVQKLLLRMDNNSPTWFSGSGGTGLCLSHPMSRPCTPPKNSPAAGTFHYSELFATHIGSATHPRGETIPKHINVTSPHLQIHKMPRQQRW